MLAKGSNAAVHSGASSSSAARADSSGNRKTKPPRFTGGICIGPRSFSGIPKGHDDALPSHDDVPFGSSFEQLGS